MATDLDIANRALSRLGAARITSLTQDTKNARAANAALEIVRLELLADHPWNPAVKRGRVYETTATVTGAADVAGRYRVTVPGHEFTVGDSIAIDDVEGALAADLNGDWIVGARGGTTIDLIDKDTGEFLDGSGFAAWTAGGTVTLKAAWEHKNLYHLPSDVLRVLSVEDEREERWQVESGRLITDLVAPLNIRYIWLNDDTETYTPIMASAFAARLAAELALEIVDSPSKRELAMIDYNTILTQAKRADAREQTPAELDESPWITVRLTG